MARHPPGIRGGRHQAKLRALRRLGHPYTDADIEGAPARLQGLREIDALIAYLQMLGTGLGADAAADTDAHGGH